MSGPASVTIALTAFALSCAATRLLIWQFAKIGRLDTPNQRSSHKVPTPRGGGWGILIGIAGGLLVAALFGRVLPAARLLPPAALIALISDLDDRRGGISAALRLTIHCAAAILAVALNGHPSALPLPPPFNIPLGPLAPMIAVVWLVAVTNIFNFLDGIDGFAALQAILASLGAYFLFEESSLRAFALTMAGASAGFIIWNWQPARIFLGDVGSATVGFLLACLPLQAGSTSHLPPIYVMSLLLWFFLADGTLTLVLRLARGERIWEPHRSHIYQRLVQSGLSHRIVSLTAHIGSAFILFTLIISEHFAPKAVSVIDWLPLAAAILCFASYLALLKCRSEQQGKPWSLRNPPESNAQR